MSTAHVFIATSLDGFIARPDGDIDWLLQRDDPPKITATQPSSPTRT